MRAAARRLIDQFAPEIACRPTPAPDKPDAGKVNALEAPYEPASEPIPTSWTPEHICKRIVEAFETLSTQAAIRGPRMPGNAWPEIMIEWADQLAQHSTEAAERRAKSRNHVRLIPSAEELRRMDIVLGWLSDLYKADSGLCRVVQRWAKLRAAHDSVKADCRRTGLSFQVFYRQRDKGVAKIVEAIRMQPVW